MQKKRGDRRRSRDERLERAAVEALQAGREGLDAKGESLWAVYRRRFKKHTLGKVGAVVLIILYTTALFAGFLSPADMIWADKTKSYHPPTGIRWLYADLGRTAIRPYVYEQKLLNVALKKYGLIPLHSLRVVSVTPRSGLPKVRAVSTEKDAGARKREIVEAATAAYDLPDGNELIRNLASEIDRIESDPKKDVTYRVVMGSRNYLGTEIPLELLLVKGNKNFLRFFPEGTPYKLWGLIPTNRHFFGSPTGGYFALGLDQYGRDILSRLFHGSRVSLSVGLLGALISFAIGLLFGGLAGYFGGVVDNVMMRFSEITYSFPAIYLLFTLRAIFPSSMTSVQIYIMIVGILAMVSWTSLARVIRGMVLSLKNEDYVLSAMTMGLSHLKIITRHILPNTLSFVIVQATITIPSYILGESALSLLGLGITEPQSSWGLMLAVARNYRVVKDFPWVLVPGFAIFIAIMAWNFFGDGVRDAVDPRSKH
jgi:peptide/nickel transport system permease protein